MGEKAEIDASRLSVFVDEFVPIKKFLCDNGVVIGFAEVRRLIYQGLISVNGVVVSDPECYVQKGDLVKILKRID